MKIDKTKEQLMDELKTLDERITELESKLKDFLNTKDELEKIVQSSPAAIIVFDFDGRVRRWNPAAERIFGWTKKEVIGKLCPTIPPEYIANVLSKEFEQLKQGKELIYNPLQEPFEVISLKKDGSEVHMSLSVAPIQGPSGEPEGVINVMMDLTERKEFEAKLKESKNRYKAIFDNTGTATYIFNKKGIITMQNSEMMKISGYAPEEVEGKMTWMELIPPKELKMMMEYHKKRQKDPTLVPKKYESRFITKDRTIRNVQITVDKITESEEYVSSAIDITDLRDAEKELKKSLEEKEMLLKEIYHRTKNNLMIISSLLNIQSKFIKDKESQEIFQESQDRARSMALIHERLYQSTDLKRIDFSDYVRTLSTELFHAYSDDTGRIKLIINLEEVFIDINNAIPLGLIINELITNSLKYAFPEGRDGEITLDFHKKEDLFELTVKDDGVGFPEDLNYRSTSSLGLQLVNSLTEQINGEVKLEGTNGTCFKITFKN